VVLKAIDNLNAISGVMPARRFKIADNVLRLTSNAVAASLTLNPKGSKQSAFKTSPG